MAQSSTPSEINRAVAAIASRQYGAIGRWQLLDLGLSSNQIDRRIQSGLLLRLSKGVYTAGHGNLSRSGRWMAALLACGPDAMLSHRTAASAWKLLPDEKGVDVTVRSDRNPPDWVRLHRTRKIGDSEVRRLGNLRVTSVARTILDLAAVVPPRVTEDAFSAARRLGLLRLRELRASLEGRPNLAGAGLVRELISIFEQVTAPSMSELQDRAFALCVRAGLPRPLTEVAIGRFTVDMLWPEEMVILEVDGEAYHGDKFHEDRDRDQVLNELCWIAPVPRG